MRETAAIMILLFRLAHSNVMSIISDSPAPFKSVLLRFILLQHVGFAQQSLVSPCTRMLVVECCECVSCAMCGLAKFYGQSWTRRLIIWRHVLLSCLCAKERSLQLEFRCQVKVFCKSKCFLPSEASPFLRYLLR